MKSYWSLDPAVTFLNHGSFGACPKLVQETQAALREEMEREPVRFLWREIEGHVDHARTTLAQFLHANPEEIAFVTNATSAINAIVRSLDFRPDDEIVVTNHGYNACKNVVDECARRTSARVVTAIIPFPIQNPDEAIEPILRALTQRTRLVLLDHITSPTAIVLPVETLIREIEHRGIPVLVDGAHAPGMVDLNLDLLRPSYYTGNLHKWVCAPKGAAFIFVRAELQKDLHPAVLSHGYNTPRPGRSQFHSEFDWQGTQDLTSWLSVPAAIDFCKSLLPGGFPALIHRNHQLAVAARGILSQSLHVQPPCPVSMLGSMATLPLPDQLQPSREPGDSRAVIQRFDPLQTFLFEKHHIEVPLIRWGSPVRRWFRVSAQAYNQLSDYQKLAEALSEASRSGQF